MCQGSSVDYPDDPRWLCYCGHSNFLRQQFYPAKQEQPLLELSFQPRLTPSFNWLRPSALPALIKNRFRRVRYRRRRYRHEATSMNSPAGPPSPLHIPDLLVAASIGTLSRRQPNRRLSMHTKPGRIPHSPSHHGTDKLVVPVGAAPQCPPKPRLSKAWLCLSNC